MPEGVAVRGMARGAQEEENALLLNQVFLPRLPRYGPFFPQALRCRRVHLGVEVRGLRALAYIENGDCRLLSRNGDGSRNSATWARRLPGAMARTTRSSMAMDAPFPRTSSVVDLRGRGLIERERRTAATGRADQADHVRGPHRHRGARLVRRSLPPRPGGHCREVGAFGRAIRRPRPGMRPDVLADGRPPRDASAAAWRSSGVR